MVYLNNNDSLYYADEEFTTLASGWDSDTNLYYLGGQATTLDNMGKGVWNNRPYWNGSGTDLSNSFGWSGMGALDFSNVTNISGAIFSDIDFSENDMMLFSNVTNMAGVVFENANLSNKWLVSWPFSGGVTFRGCNLNGTYIGDDLTGMVVEYGFDGTPTTFVNAMFWNSMTGLVLTPKPNASWGQPMMSLAGANLRGVTTPIWFGDVDLTDVQFPDALLDIAANCSSMTNPYPTLPGWDLNQSYTNSGFTGFFGGVYYIDGRYTYLDCTGTGIENIWAFAFYINGQIVNNINLNGFGEHEGIIWIYGTKYDWDIISGEDFTSWWWLSNFDFAIRYSGLVNCNFSGLSMGSCAFPADISNSNFENTNLVGANFSNVINAAGANFSGADLTDAIYPNRAFFNGAYYIGGQATDLDSEGNGAWNGGTYVGGVLQGGGESHGSVVIQGRIKLLGKVKFG